MSETVSKQGYRFANSVLREVAAHFDRVPEDEILREARLVDDGNRYLDRRELTEGAARAKYKIDHPAPERPKVREGFLSWSSVSSHAGQLLRTALRQVLADHGPIARAPDASRFRPIACFSDGPAGRDNLMSIVVPTGIDGKPNLSGGPDGTTTFYYRRDDFGKAPKFYGPFEMNAGGFVVRSLSDMKLVQGGEIAIDAVKKAFETVLYKSAGTDGNQFFGPIDVGHIRSDAAVRKEVVKPVLDEWSTGRRRSIELLDQGPGALATYLKEVHTQSDGRASLKFVLDELKSSGQIANTFTYRVAEAEYGGIGSRLGVLVRESTMLVIVDQKGRAFGFKEGTL